MKEGVTGKAESKQQRTHISGIERGTTVQATSKTTVLRSAQRAAFTGIWEHLLSINEVDDRLLELGEQSICAQQIQSTDCKIQSSRADHVQSFVLLWHQFQVISEEIDVHLQVERSCKTT